MVGRTPLLHRQSQDHVWSMLGLPGPPQTAAGNEVPWSSVPGSWLCQGHQCPEGGPLKHLGQGIFHCSERCGTWVSTLCSPLYFST